MPAPALQRLGDRDPMLVLRQLVPWLRERTGGADDETLVQPEEPGRWSVLAAVEHLVDAEIVHATRLRMVLQHDQPTLAGWDPDLWATKGRYDAGDLQQDLALLDLLRARNLELLAGLSDEDRTRVGIHTSRGPEDMALMIARMADHDLIHRRQIDRILAAVKN